LNFERPITTGTTHEMPTTQVQEPLVTQTKRKRRPYNSMSNPPQPTREDVRIQTRSGSVTIPKGSTLPFTYRNNSIVRIRFQSEDYEIPISLTDLE
jgi:hypothetical protein